MARVVINNGDSGLDVRAALNANFTELYAAAANPYPVVATFADLPAASAHGGEVYLVETSTGVFLINRKSAGLYFSNGSTWGWVGDIDMDANYVSYTPTGGLSSTTVQAALTELDTEKQGAAARLVVTTSAVTGAIADQAIFSFNNIEGAVVQGSGSSYDLTAYNSAGNTIFSVVAGAVAVDFHGDVTVSGDVDVSGSLILGGTAISGIDTDPTMAANSDDVVPTQAAVKAYVTAHSGGGSSGAPKVAAVSGRYYWPFGYLRNASGATQAANLLIAVRLDKSITADAFVLEVTTAAAGAHVRCGIYSSDANGMPGALLVDAGAVDASTTGVKVQAFGSSKVLDGSQWLCVLSSDATVALRLMSATDGIGASLFGATSPTSFAMRRMTAAQSYGALPATFPSPASDTTDAACMMLRAA